MSTIINFKVDKELRDEAKQAAAEVGLPLGTIMTHYLKEFVNEKRVIFASHPQPNPTTSRRWEKINQDINQGKNLSPVFSNAHDAIAWLKK